MRCVKRCSLRPRSRISSFSFFHSRSGCYFRTRAHGPVLSLRGHARLCAGQRHSSHRVAGWPALQQYGRNDCNAKQQRAMRGVSAFPLTHSNAIFLNHVSHIHLYCRFVIQFDSGAMYKVKTEWYFARANQKEKQVLLRDNVLLFVKCVVVHRCVVWLGAPFQHGARCVGAAAQARP